MKRCSKCRIEKSKCEFSKRSNAADGLQFWCKACRKVSFDAYKGANKAHIKNWQKTYRVENPEAIAKAQAKYRETNRSKRNAYFALYSKMNKGKKAAVAAKRKAAKLAATPSWANQAYIALFYELARLESERIGVKVHVDHIVPLKSSKVCGLHCEHNLQLMVASANLKKSNRVWPDMPT